MYVLQVEENMIGIRWRDAKGIAGTIISSPTMSGLINQALLNNLNPHFTYQVVERVTRTENYDKPV